MPPLHRFVIAACVAFLSGCASAAAGTRNGIAPSTQAFDVLSTLAGEWEEAAAANGGLRERVSYRLIANGTVLVETWTLRSGHESMTVYYLDGLDLMATHYCPQGNQPRLRLAQIVEGGLLFTIRDGSNLEREGRSHQHEFWLRADNPNTFRRSEVYVENGVLTAPEHASADGATTYHRMPSQPPSP